MNALDASEFTPTALSALALFVGGYLVYLVQRRQTISSERTKQVDDSIAQLRSKDESLGADIQKTRSALAWACGKLGLPHPTYEKD